MSQEDGNTSQKKGIFDRLIKGMANQVKAAFGGESTGDSPTPNSTLPLTSSDPRNDLLAGNRQEGKANTLPEESRILKGHTSTVLSVSFSPDGQYLVSG